MKKINVFFKKNQKEYVIFIGNSLIEKISELYDLKKYSKVLVVTDEIIKPLFLEKLSSSLPADFESLVFPTGEKEKNIGNVQKIWKAMHEAGCDRKSLVINLGGGVITDIGGFAASTYMRGIDFINIPTTLLAQVDASVGGKTGIDFADIKNLIGTFDQPKAVIIDTETLKTLPKREFISAFGEIIKHGLISDKKYFEKVINKKPLEFTPDEIIEIITISCQKKTEITKSDETERGLRKILNFGHTIGHAIESLSLETNHHLFHGEAISIGMVAEAKISELAEFLSKRDVLQIERCLKNAELPTLISNLKIEDIKNKILSDKKNYKGKIKFTLLKKIGKAIIDQKVPDKIINEGIKYVIQR